jgi:TolB-like protein
MKQSFKVLAATSLMFSAAVLAQGQPAEIQHRLERNYVTYVVNGDGTHTETREVRTKILDKRAVEYLKRGYIGWSTSIESGEVLEAYTT